MYFTDTWKSWNTEAVFLPRLVIMERCLGAYSMLSVWVQTRLHLCGDDRPVVPELTFSGTCAWIWTPCQRNAISMKTPWGSETETDTETGRESSIGEHWGMRVRIPNLGARRSQEVARTLRRTVVYWLTPHWQHFIRDLHKVGWHRVTLCSVILSRPLDCRHFPQLLGTVKRSGLHSQDWAQRLSRKTLGNKSLLRWNMLVHKHILSQWKVHVHVLVGRYKQSCWCVTWKSRRLHAQYVLLFTSMQRI